jgi:AcrR family transcriptional regulator
MTATVRTVDGRVAGRRGQVTRQKLLDCLQEMLRTSPYRDVKVIDVARRAGTSPATFYQYFPDIETAVLGIAADMAREGAQLRSVVKDQSWAGRSGYQAARQLVDRLFDFWREHEPVLRVVDLATSEGDQRFRRIRVRMLNSITTALAETISELQESGKAAEEVHPMAMSGALVGMLAHNAAHQKGFESWDIHNEDLRESMTRLVYWGITGKKPPKTA